MNTTLIPSTTEELVEAVRSTPRLIAVGSGTKPRLSAVNTVKLSTAKLTGIVEYEPSEFTFTALAGTPLREISKTLAAQGQYLPFDPMLVESGATLGGTIASGVSGPGRFRFGGLRDFILAIQFVDGAGRLLRMGGKVVKNAAGFDLPKFFVGSLGRFGVLTEVTFKVFPRHTSRLTLMLEAKTPELATQILSQAASSRWEIDALDWLPASNHGANHDAKQIAARLVGPAESLDAIADEILNRFPGEKVTTDVADVFWRSLSEIEWAYNTTDSDVSGRSAAILKMPTTPDTSALLRRTLEEFGARVLISAGGNVAFASLVSAADFKAVDAQLQRLKVPCLTLRGDAPLWMGARHDFKIAAAVKNALDAENRFPGLEEFA
jgi:glycolate oxidase FAD binding subunit